ncbi:MAG: hypothetical protein IPH28_12965 [Cytophagaceae bacterium]|nr:hypothetical protein [Cytophagaceae bacterium]
MIKSTLLGIWMDHQEAHIIEYSIEQMSTKIILSKFTQEVKEESLAHGESGMNTKNNSCKQNIIRKFLMKLKKYEGVLIMGPGTSKSELLNSIKDNPVFMKINIVLQQSFQMTENQKYAYIREYFSKQYLY